MNKYMSLQELKSRLRIADAKDDEYLQELLDDVVEFVINWTNNKFNGKFPRDVKRAVAQLVSLEMQADNLVSGGIGSGGDSEGQGEVKSVKIDGLSETYATKSESASGAFGAWEKYLELPNGPFSILRMYRLLKFKSLGSSCRRR